MAKFNSSALFVLVEFTSGFSSFPAECVCTTTGFAQKVEIEMRDHFQRLIPLSPATAGWLGFRRQRPFVQSPTNQWIKKTFHFVNHPFSAEGRERLRVRDSPAPLRSRRRKV